MEQRFTLKTYRGDTPRWPMTFFAGEGEARAPLSLEGCAIIFTAKGDAQVPDGEAALQQVIPPTDHVDPAAGKTELALTTAQTTLPVGEYHCDLKLIQGSDVRTLAVGRLQVRQPVTHAVSAPAGEGGE